MEAEKEKETMNVPAQDASSKEAPEQKDAEWKEPDQKAPDRKASDRKAPTQKAPDQRELVCIRCPMGCRITVTHQSDGSLQITGNTCNRGAEYAEKELTNPTRTVTSTVPVTNGKQRVVSVKTKEDIPKGRIMDCIKALKEVKLEAPVAIGDVALANAAGTGVDIIVTKNVERMERKD